MHYNKILFRLITSLFVMVMTVYVSLSETSVNASTEHKNTLFSPFAYIGAIPDEDEKIKIENVEKTEDDDTRHDVETDDENMSTNNRILVYHSHTTEAYLESAENRYENLASRSSVESLTVKKVGEALCDAFAKYGIDSDHDKTNNEAKGYSYAYTESRETIAKNVDMNGEYKLYIDLHRDAYVKNTVPTVEIDGKSVAKIMLVVGGKSLYADENYALAKKIEKELDAIHPDLCEKVRYVSSSIYNQDISTSCILVEIGDNAVSIEEACNAAEYAAMAISKVLNK